MACHVQSACEQGWAAAFLAATECAISFPFILKPFFFLSRHLLTTAGAIAWHNEERALEAATEIYARLSPEYAHMAVELVTNTIQPWNT
jgi:hypothetical protein